MPTRLFHFSDSGSIATFVPRSVRVPAQRAPGFDWLNGPLVWAIDCWHQPMYLFPRECPRILIWQTGETQAKDAKVYFSNTKARIVAYIEKRWAPKLQTAVLYRYEFPTTSFQSLKDAGMWISQSEVIPIEQQRFANLPHQLQSHGVELRCVDNLTQLRDVWESSLHVSGIRLRNAKGLFDH